MLQTIELILSQYILQDSFDTKNKAWKQSNSSVPKSVTLQLFEAKRSKVLDLLAICGKGNILPLFKESRQLHQMYMYIVYGMT